MIYHIFKSHDSLKHLFIGLKSLRIDQLQCKAGFKLYKLLLVKFSNQKISGRNLMMVGKYMGKLVVIIELIIMLIIIKVKASDLVLPSPLNSHLDNFHSPLHRCLETKLQKCEEIEERPEQLRRDLCISVAFANCFKEAIPYDPVYKIVEECFKFCHLFTYLYANCLKLVYKNHMKRL